MLSRIRLWRCLEIGSRNLLLTRGLQVVLHCWTLSGVNQYFVRHRHKKPRGWGSATNVRVDSEEILPGKDLSNSFYTFFEVSYLELWLDSLNARCWSPQVVLLRPLGVQYSSQSIAGSVRRLDASLIEDSDCSSGTARVVWVSQQQSANTRSRWSTSRGMESLARSHRWESKYVGQCSPTLATIAAHWGHGAWMVHSDRKRGETLYQQVQSTWGWFEGRS